MKVAVIGLGKIGLPLATQCALGGFLVFGVDTNPKVVNLINKGLEPFPGERDLGARLKSLVPGPRFRATVSFADGVRDAGVIVVAVPLLVDSSDQPDFSSIDSATRSIGEHLSRDALVIYETTLPIGTTRKRLKPLLEATSGMEEGKDFHLVFSPERVFTGRIFEDLANYPKIIGALGRSGAEKALDFYSRVLDFAERSDLPRPNGVWDLGSAEAAEFAKLAETTYRDVNIALANQFGMHAGGLGLDIDAIIEACNSQPFSHIHNPGISVGGHCIPIYPKLYLNSDPGATLVMEARRVNEAMPYLALEKLNAQVGGLAGKTALILGASYRAGVKEHTKSGVFDLYEGLKGMGCVPSVVDPMYDSAELEELGLHHCPDFENVECVILHTDHEEFLSYSKEDFPNLQIMFDGRAFLDRNSWEGIPILSI